MVISRKTVKAGGSIDPETMMPLPIVRLKSQTSLYHAFPWFNMHGVRWFTFRILLNWKNIPHHHYYDTGGYHLFPFSIFPFSIGNKGPMLKFTGTSVLEIMVIWQEGDRGLSLLPFLPSRYYSFSDIKSPCLPLVLLILLSFSKSAKMISRSANLIPTSRWSKLLTIFHSGRLVPIVPYFLGSEMAVSFSELLPALPLTSHPMAF